MKIATFLWKNEFIEKLERKHAVATVEVEEAFRNAPHFDFVAKGHVVGENGTGRWARLMRDDI